MRAMIETVENCEDKLVIRDCGDWSRVPTVTNDAEGVVKWLYDNKLLSSGKRLLYYDSEGSLDELVHRDGRFVGFKCL